MVYGFFFCSMMEWKLLKKKYCVVAMVVLVLDLVPSFNLPQYGVITSQDTIADVEALRELTTQRAAVIDISSYGSYPSFGISGDDGVCYTFGWAWQGAVTGDNIVLLNEALENEKYLYLFDRCVELGDDTVLIRKTYVGQNGGTNEDMIEAAEQSNYSLVKETEGAYIFKMEAPEQFGVKTCYKGIVIGEYANAMTINYPSFTVGASDVIDEYDFEELKDYQVIFLTGFEYKNKENAEKLLKELAGAGVRVVIDSTHMPADSKTNQETFLGVTSQQVHFEGHYPTLEYQGELMNTESFSDEDYDFSTGYIAGVDHVLGSFQMGNQTLTFLGYNEENPDIYFVGLNLMYFVTETGDQAVLNLLNDVLTIPDTELPVREIVELKVVKMRSYLMISAEDEGTALKNQRINTTIAYQDIFQSDRDIYEENNLLEVKAGVTLISLTYPMWKAGLLVSAFGLLGGVGMVTILCFSKKDKKVK
jgi:uncharacterized membrane protein